MDKQLQILLIQNTLSYLEGTISLEALLYSGIGFIPNNLILKDILTSFNTIKEKMGEGYTYSFSELESIFTDYLSQLTSLRIA